MHIKKQQVLVFADYYLPGFKAGGPVRSIANLVEALGDEIDFYILTRAHDFNDKTPYKGLKTGEFQQVGKANVMYLNSGDITAKLFDDIFKSRKWGSLYFNSLLSPKFSILPQLVLKQKGYNFKTILAPRGELNPSALKQKWLKKKLFLTVSKIFGLHKNLIWQASSIDEKRQIINNYAGGLSDIKIAPDVFSVSNSLELKEKIEKKVGDVSLCFISRIRPNKGLHIALESLKHVRSNVTFSIYGVVEDSDYMDECINIINELTCNVNVLVEGEVEPNKVIETLSKHHGFIFPTQFENFGHVILEAMVARCIPVISKCTPWKGLEDNKCGFICDIDNMATFTQAIENISQMDSKVFTKWSDNAGRFALNNRLVKSAIQANRELFIK